jgi:hypothetical protein
MVNRKRFVGICVGILVIAGVCVSLVPKKKESVPEITQEKVETAKAAPVRSKSVKHVKPPIEEQQIDLYNNTDKLMPLCGIVDLAKCPESVKNTIQNILDKSSCGIYFLKRVKNKYIVIVDTLAQDEENAQRRHDFEVIEISASDGKVLNDENYTNEEAKSSEIENWYNDENEPVKYKKTDKDGNVLSLRKETVENQTTLREEHLFYSKDGSVKMDVSFNYDGADLTRFTYFDSSNEDESFTVINEYEDGVKTKETLYSTDYKLLNTYVPKYKDSKKTEIIVFDDENNQSESITGE